MRYLPIALVALISTTQAMAQSQQRCVDYIDTVVQPITIDAAIASLQRVPKVKGEYETSPDFAKRQAATLPGGTEPLIVAKALDLAHIRYNADWQVLDVGLYAFDNLGASYAELFGVGTPYDGKVPYGLVDNIDVVVSQQEGGSGSYIGSTAFGGHTRVTKVTRVKKPFLTMKPRPAMPTF